jgi:hypothetical protein
VISVPANFPLHNELRPSDVNNDGHVSPLDALIVINTLDEGPPVDGGMYIDTNRDGQLSPLDALLVINELDNAPVAALSEVASIEFPSDADSAMIVPVEPTETRRITSARDLATDIVLSRQEAIEFTSDVSSYHHRWRPRRLAGRAMTPRVWSEAWIDDLALDVSQPDEQSFQ